MCIDINQKTEHTLTTNTVQKTYGYFNLLDSNHDFSQSTYNLDTSAIQYTEYCTVEITNENETHE